MPLEDLSRFVSEEKLTRTAPLENLRGSRIAIDGQYWLKILAPKIDEPFLAAIGGIPLTMGNVVRNELRKFKNAGIDPVFVFNGLPTTLTQSPIQLVQNPFLHEIYDRRESAWKAFHEKKPHRELFRGTTAHAAEFQHQLIRVLRSEDVEFFKAPYIAWAQMAYWSSKEDKSVHQAVGPLELIMFDHIDVLLTDLNFDASPPEFSYLMKEDILRKLSEGLKGPDTLSPSQFLDCCLLTGVKGQIKHPRLPGLVGKSFAEVAEKLASAGKIQKFILGRPPIGGPANPQTPSNQTLLKEHMRTRAIIRHSLVFTLAGEVIPMTVATTIMENGDKQAPPRNLSDLWGHRLPNILYYLISVNSLHTQILVYVVQNHMIEMIPLVDTDEYRDLILKILPLKTQVAYHLVHQLSSRDQKYVRANMTCWRWFGQFETALKPPASIRLDEWDVKQSEISEYQKEGSDATINFDFVIRHFSRNACREKKYETFEEVLCAVFLKSLDILGYFTHTRTADPPISGLSRFSEALRKADSPEFCEYLVLVIELLRTKALSRDHYTYRKPDPTDPKRSNDPWDGDDAPETTHFPIIELPPTYVDAPSVAMRRQYDWCCLVITRVLSLLPMELQEAPWYSGLSKDLLAFSTIVKALYRTLRNLTEVASAVLFLDGKTGSISPDIYQQIPHHLPYGQESNTVMGIVFDYIMRKSENFDDPDISTREQRIEHLKVCASLLSSLPSFS
eukprot:TRINITY_DN6715_c0_g1_i4.p1 TRINITY_DN6715_c0_g1~~TRINITY_DN6715_c0_g1_i4.p1  ORF type:complete len:730 (+),score=63.20 TRINITY_DN6715_c0_g1_i4:40-2229(+)